MAAKRSFRTLGPILQKMCIIMFLSGFVLFYFYRRPFLLLPLLLMLYCIYPLIFSLERSNFLWHTEWALFLSSLVNLFAIYLDCKEKRPKQDYAIWLYLFAMPLFFLATLIFFEEIWVGNLSALLMIVAGILLYRRVVCLSGIICGFLLNVVLFHGALIEYSILIFYLVMLILILVLWKKIKQVLLKYFNAYLPPGVIYRINH